MRTLIRTRLGPLMAALLLGMANAPFGFAQDAATPPAELSGPEQLKSWDQAMEQFRQGMWTLQSLPEAQVKDSRGKTFAQDVNERIFLPEVTERLDKLRARAGEKEADPVALKAILDEATPVFETETYRVGLISFYWMAFNTLKYHEQLLEPWLARADEADRQAVRTHMATTEQSLVKLLDTGLAQTGRSERADSMRQLTLARTRAADFYNERRVTFADRQSGIPGATPSKSIQNAIPCPPPVAPVPGKEKPGLAADNQALEEVYPAQAKRFGVQGPVTLRVEIAETGCLERVELARSSGSEELDDAAMLWAERARYTPAEKDKKAVAGSFTYRVKFELKD